ncbi:tetraacyldisaccharide 4'-kinase [Agriterribacter sp.]|uniref:tetraacyldisaccharide 4'-kinase n=1 Tax=Agriterribacter sp. TaxID=2821509 RepID=UPI002CB698A8|nr:tetraacyldisaccharide 4'-kinase [Agriterribacter sp.]HRP57838.1 tetraacyldisaccharide 4'-kinase [Agriterribacter sp.]
MNFSSVWLRSFRVLLFPFAFLYGTAVKIRNYLYDNEVIQSIEFNFPVICVGNISVGGTGKSPMVEYLLRLLVHRYKTATLSRGYKRKTRGYVLADDKTTALDIGDEPMQFHIKFPEVTVAVGEERAIAIPQLLFDRPGTDVIILDDALQHRTVKAGLNILLTDYNNLFTRDMFLPTGDLRDSRSSYKRADIIIVTKCSDNLGSTEKEKITSEIQPLTRQHLFFTGIRYGAPYHIISRAIKHMSKETEVLLACGIANPGPLKQYIQEESATYDAIYYRDHYIFTIDDLKDIRQRFEKIKAADKMILVTEKDAVRLVKFAAELRNMPVYVQPIETYFLFNESQRFNYLIENFIQDFKIKS